MMNGKMIELIGEWLSRMDGKDGKMNERIQFFFHFFKKNLEIFLALNYKKKVF